MSLTRQAVIEPLAKPPLKHSLVETSPPPRARHTKAVGQCGAQPIIAEQFAAGRGGPRGAEEGKTDGLVRGGRLTRGRTVRRNPCLSALFLH